MEQERRWIELTVRECAIVEAYTGIVMLTGDKRKYICQYAEEKLGYPVYTHYWASETFNMLLKRKATEDFLNLCKNSVEPKEGD